MGSTKPYKTVTPGDLAELDGMFVDKAGPEHGYHYIDGPKLETLLHDALRDTTTPTVVRRDIEKILNHTSFTMK